MADVWRRTDPLVLQPDEGWTVRPSSDLQGDRFMISGAATGGRFALVTHPVEPGWFSPPHIHTREDEYSFILEGQSGSRSGIGSSKPPRDRSSSSRGTCATPSGTSVPGEA
jgi:hypothetical protein